MLAMVIMILFIVLLLVSVPISATLSAVSLAPSLLDPNFHISAEYIIRAMLGGIDSFPLLAVPMFVLSGIQAESVRSCLMSSPIFLESIPQECPVPSL